MFKVATYNIHKGQTLFKGCNLSGLKQGLNELNADIICLQEVQETSRRRSASIDAHGASQLLALQSNRYPYAAYGANAVYHHGHHGNAIWATCTFCAPILAYLKSAASAKPLP
jgi:endonuclease/exonuclease/phosphatase family metal-dependent hydrolase